MPRRCGPGRCRAGGGRPESPETGRPEAEPGSAEGTPDRGQASHPTGDGHVPHVVMCVGDKKFLKCEVLGDGAFSAEIIIKLYRKCARHAYDIK